MLAKVGWECGGNWADPLFSSAHNWQELGQRTDAFLNRYISLIGFSRSHFRLQFCRKMSKTFFRLFIILIGRFLIPFHGLSVVFINAPSQFVH